jgi:hypothetical protein
MSKDTEQVEHNQVKLHDRDVVFPPMKRQDKPYE